MYECPNDCGSTTFVQTIKQVETVHLNDAGDPTQFEKNGGSEILDLSCGDCGAELNTETAVQQSDEKAVPLDEIIHHGQQVGAIFVLSNGSIIAVDDWYTYDELGTYKVYSGGDTFHIDQEDVEEMATRRFVNEVVLDE